MAVFVVPPFVMFPPALYVHAKLVALALLADPSSMIVDFVQVIVGASGKILIVGMA